MQDPEPPKECCSDFQAKFAEWRDCAEKSIREEPTKSALVAFVAGLFLTVLPVGAILGGLVRVALALVRPALLLLGIVKLAEELDKRKKN